MEKKINQRLDWIDISKGIGMLCIMLGHAPHPDNMTKSFYTFHVPLFFFLSGILFSAAKYRSFGAFMKRQFWALVIPYISFSIFNYIFWILIYHNVGDNPYSNEGINILAPILGTVIAVRDLPWTLHNVALWFLACLFVAEILFYLIMKLTGGSHKKISICLFISSILGYLYCTYVGVKMPWSFDAALTAVVFLGAGYLMKEKIYKIINNITYLPFFLLINIITGSLNSRVNLYENQYGNYVMFYISAFSGIFSVITFAKKFEKQLDKIKILTFIGRNSLVYLGFHQYILFPFIGIALENISFYRLDNIHVLIIKGISYTLIAAVVIAPIAVFMNRYTPFLLGKRKQI